jgi:hypothetical protein
MECAPGTLRLAAFVESDHCLGVGVSFIVHALSANGGKEPALNFILYICRIGSSRERGMGSGARRRTRLSTP